jgi:hypothetical protein
MDAALRAGIKPAMHAATARTTMAPAIAPASTLVSVAIGLIGI